MPYVMEYSAGSPAFDHALYGPFNEQLSVVSQHPLSVSASFIFISASTVYYYEINNSILLL